MSAGDPLQVVNAEHDEVEVPVLLKAIAQFLLRILVKVAFIAEPCKFIGISFAFSVIGFVQGLFAGFNQAACGFFYLVGNLIHSAYRLQNLLASLSLFFHRVQDVVLNKFDAIGDGVKTVAVQEDNILISMEEQGEGSKQILQSVGNVNEVTHQVKEAARRLVETSKETLHKTNDSEAKAFTDELTGLRNKSYFDENAEQELRYCIDENREFSLILFSIDNIRKLADTHGSDIRNDLLKILSMRTRNTIKQGTLIARYSDEQFVITLPNVRHGTAVKLAEQIQKKIKDTPFAAKKGVKIDGSISLAIVTKTDSAKTLRDIIATAEKALSDAQASGINKIVSA